MDYQVHLDQFEGPLDLLLHLIGTAKIDIEQIFVSRVTEQYLEFMEELPELDMDAASEFARMAATLVYLKSKSVLPHKVEEDPEADEMTEEQLFEKLREYKAAKIAGEALRELEADGLKRYYKLPEEFPVSRAPLDLSGVTLDLLAEIYREMMAREPALTVEKQVHIKQERVSVHQRIREISAIIKQTGRVSFRELCEASTDRIDIVVTFLAILDMTMTGSVKLTQQRRFDDIIIVAGEAA